MLNYIVAFVLKTVYKVNVYVPRNIIEHLEQYFDNIDQDIIPVAEQSLCGLWQNPSACLWLAIVMSPVLRRVFSKSAGRRETLLAGCAR